MSKDIDLEYCGKGLKGIFSHKKNLFNLNFLKMFIEILKFYKKSSKLNEFNVETAETISHGIKKILLNETPGRVLICGSFYMYKEVSELLKK